MENPSPSGAFVVIAPGAGNIEAATVIDVARRADIEVVADGRPVTRRRGPATSMAFGPKRVELPAGKNRRDEVAAAASLTS